MDVKYRGAQNTWLEKQGKKGMLELHLTCNLRIPLQTAQEVTFLKHTQFWYTNTHNVISTSATKWAKHNLHSKEYIIYLAAAHIYLTYFQIWAVRKVAMKGKSNHLGAKANAPRSQWNWATGAQLLCWQHRQDTAVGQRSSEHSTDSCRSSQWSSTHHRPAQSYVRTAGGRKREMGQHTVAWTQGAARSSMRDEFLCSFCANGALSFVSTHPPPACYFAPSCCHDISFNFSLQNAVWFKSVHKKK